MGEQIGAGFIGCDALDQSGMDHITGLNQLIPSLPTTLTEVINASASKECPVLTGPQVWAEGNILLGGGGSDVLEGRVAMTSSTATATSASAQTPTTRPLRSAAPRE